MEESEAPVVGNGMVEMEAPVEGNAMGESEVPVEGGLPSLVEGNGMVELEAPVEGYAMGESEVPAEGGLPFHVGQTFCSEDECIATISLYAAENYFSVVKGAGHGSNKKGGSRRIRLECSRSGMPATKKRKSDPELTHSTKRRKSKSLKCGCTFAIRGSVRNGEVKITLVSLQHTNGCVPSHQHVLSAKSRSGDYFKNLTDTQRRELLLLFDNRAPTRKVIEFIRTLVPSGCPVTSMMVANWKTSLSKCTTKIFDIKNTSQFNDLSLPLISLSEKCARDLVQQSMESEGVPILTYCRQLRIRDSCFDFRTMVDPVTSQLTGIIWQTGRQRLHAQRFCDNLFLDCRKKGNNDLRWPYFGPVISDENRKTRVIAHCLAIAEDVRSYSFIMQSLIDMSGIDARSVKVVWSDRFLSQDRIAEYFPDAVWRMDQWHLLTVDLPRAPRWNAQASEQVRTLINANSEEDFYMRWEGMKLVHPSTLIQHLENAVVKDFRACAKFAVVDVLTLGFLGDAPAEQGNAQWSSWYESDILSPVNLLDLSLKRENNKSAVLSSDLFNLEVTLEKELMNTTSTFEIAVKKEQSAFAVRHFMNEKNESSMYQLRESTIEDGGDGFQVKRIVLKRESKEHTVRFRRGLALHSCPSFKNMGIPCRHILFARIQANEPLYVAEEFHPR
tara:strand:+ start:141 stop:2150 length:2010 start_codon:yes stop_codon:yes gene_type:complete